MKQTLLQMTQSILSSLNSDEVNSISDTTESLQVAEIIKQTYFNFIARADLPEHYELFQLTPSNDEESPILMYKPDNVKFIEWMKYYDTSLPVDDSTGEHDINTDITDTGINNLVSPNPQYKYITILPNLQFIDMVNSFNVNDIDVSEFDLVLGSSHFKFLYKNRQQPNYCTVVKDQYIVFDAFDENQDSTLQASKTMCHGMTIPYWQNADSFIPSLDDQQFPLLLNEAKSLAFLELKQMSHPKAEQESKRQWSSLQKTKALVDSPTAFDALPNFGRVRGYQWR